MDEDARITITFKPQHLERLAYWIVIAGLATLLVLAFLKDYIIFAEKDEELSKFILRQHQKEAVERVVHRAHEAGRRGLVAAPVAPT